MWIQKFDIEAAIEDDSPNVGMTDVTVKRDMVPTHKNISDFEETLERVGRQYGGENDSWSCFSV